MRKVLILFFITLFCAFANAQSAQVMVVYKNGSSVIGTLLGMDGTTSVTISLTGLEVTIPMEEVKSIESVA